jgi:glycosyltransferase involved in cell wall biosynthesis
MMKENIPSISVIICTRNRCLSLKETLDTIAALDLADVPEFELIVVDNGSSDDTRQMAQNFVETAPFPVSVVVEGRPGLSQARNTGLKVARHELIMFTDDDCLVATNWAKIAVHLFQGDLKKLVAGRVELYDETHLPLAVKNALDRQELTSYDNILGFLHGANMSFGRCVMEIIGEFDTNLGAGSHLKSAEDSEFVYRAYKHGIPVIYEPDLRVWHNHGRTGSIEWYRQMTDHAVGTGGMIMKHLIGGNPTLIKIGYWDFRSAIRRWQNDRSEWRRVVAKSAMIKGAFQYLVRNSWKKNK